MAGTPRVSLLLLLLLQCVSVTVDLLLVARAAHRRHVDAEAQVRRDAETRYEATRAAVDAENTALRAAYEAFVLNEHAIAQDSKRCPKCARVVRIRP